MLLVKSPKDIYCGYAKRYNYPRKKMEQSSQKTISEDLSKDKRGGSQKTFFWSCHQMERRGEAGVILFFLNSKIWATS